MGKISAFGKAAAQERSKPGSRFQSKPRKIKFLFNRLSEKTAFYGLAATAFLAVTLYGAVDGWAESLIVFLICAVALFRVAGYLTGSRAAFFRKETTSLLLPLIGILILAAIQIIPFGGETISEDVYATKRFILLLTALVIAFEILLFYTTSRKKLQTLTAVVIAAGVGSAILGVLREVAGTPENPFFSEYFTYETGFAQYVNRNHFMFLLEMSVGLLCGLTLKGDLNEK